MLLTFFFLFYSEMKLLADLNVFWLRLSREKKGRRLVLINFYSEGHSFSVVYYCFTSLLFGEKLLYLPVLPLYLIWRIKVPN